VTTPFDQQAAAAGCTSRALATKPAASVLRMILFITIPRH
jgi:hypothetical protein